MGEARLQCKMGTEIEHASADIQTPVTIPSSTQLTSVPKTSMFGKKLGFVIPKNKLSGSLVPLFRGNKKGDADSMNEEATNQVQRKTKWGPDLTLETTVRKGRALAYQTRINQISQQLTLGTLELDDNEDSLTTSEIQYGTTSDHQLSKEESELLELERREIIGEILKLNPTYKAPADYKPLLKEAKVPIPIKEYPGYNFIGLVFGPASDTHKRLEKETGAKIQVYGTKADTGVKVQVTPTDGKEIDNSYEDLYVHVSADTFEKIDAAVALIELLVTPVSVNPVSSSTTSTTPSDDNVNVQPSQIAPSSTAPALINQGTAQPYPLPIPHPRGQFPQYSQPWFRSGPTHSPTYPQSGLVTPANFSAPLLSNTVQVSSSPFNPANMPSLFGPQPGLAASFSPVSRPQLPHALQPSYPQQAPQNMRPDNPPHSASESARWLPPPPASTSASQGLTNIMRMTPQGVPSHGHNAMAPQNMVVSGAPPQMSIPNNTVLPLSGPPQAIHAGIMPSQQFQGGFSPLLPSASQSSPSTIQTPSIGPRPQIAMHAPSPNAIRGPAPLPFTFQPHHPNAISRPPPSSSDFTFQPHGPPNAASQQVWPSSQPAHHNVRPSIQAGQASSLAPQSPFLRPMAHLNPSPGPGFPRPQVSHQFDQPRPQVSMNFAGSPPSSLVPPRHQILPGQHNMQARNFVPPHPLNNFSGPFPPRPGSQMHIQEKHFPGPIRPPHQQFGNHPGRPFSSSSGAQQTYDPFSPTSVSFNRQMGGGCESDPEYEDLMASVGVK